MPSYIPVMNSVEEYVTIGHPDKVADQISDAVLDAYITEDPHARVACECIVTNNLVVVAGEITSTAKVDVEQITRKSLCEIGYASPGAGIDGVNCRVIVAIQPQSPELGTIVHQRKANDQSIVIGYASRETSEYMPKTFLLARCVAERLVAVRQDCTIPSLLPDGKVQLVLRQSDEKPELISITVSPQHQAEIDTSFLKEKILEEVILKCVSKDYLSPNTHIHIGNFTIGGPSGDTGLTGRKIIIDAYGNTVPHGGGAFSGKDPTKVDRSGAYFARYLAKNVVANNLSERCLVHLGYSKGLAQPVLFEIYTGELNYPMRINEEIRNLLKTCFPDMCPDFIIEKLDLRKPIYSQTARWGHFGINRNLPWEQVDILI